MELKTTLWEHQNTMLNFALDRLNTTDEMVVGHGWDVATIKGGYAWWLAGCSTGKTLAAFALMHTMNFKKVLVITTKAGAISAWLKGAEKHLDNVTVVAPVGMTKAQKKLELVGKKDSTYIYVINYESAWRIKSELIRFGFECIITDESHKIKAHNSAQSIGIAEIASYIPYKLAMTGTGFEEKPTDVYGQVRYLDPIREKRKSWQSNILGTWTKFFDTYVTYYSHNNVKIPKGYKNLDDLRSILDPFTLYVDSEVVLDLPNVVDIERYVAPNKAIATAYRDMELDFVTRVGGDVIVADSILEQSLRLHQITSGYYPNKLGEATALVPDKENPKLQEVLSILDEIGGKPTVIFTRFREDVAILKRNLEANGYSVRLLTGDTNQQVEWQYNNDGQILIANIQAGGEAVDLTRSRYCIYYSIGHSRASFVQSLARIRRVGADLNHPVTYYHIMMKDTIDVAIRKGMQGKGELSEYLLEGLKNRT